MKKIHVGILVFSLVFSHGLLITASLGQDIGLELGVYPGDSAKYLVQSLDVGGSSFVYQSVTKDDGSETTIKVTEGDRFEVVVTGSNLTIGFHEVNGSIVYQNGVRTLPSDVLEPVDVLGGHYGFVMARLDNNSQSFLKNTSKLDWDKYSQTNPFHSTVHSFDGKNLVKTTNYRPAPQVGVSPQGLPEKKIELTRGTAGSSASSFTSYRIISKYSVVTYWLTYYLFQGFDAQNKTVYEMEWLRLGGSVPGFEIITVLVSFLAIYVILRPKQRNLV